jgi:SAM-dependent methyltransferase
VEAARLLLEGHERDTVISFLDVAAGPATLAVEVLKRLSKVDGATGRAFVTDSAQGMLDAARDRLDAARLAGEVPPGVAVECALADGCDLGAFADGSMTHAGVMFGIMFYADVGRGLQELRRVLRAGGRAVVGTWRRAGVAELIADFARFLGLPPPDASDPTSPAAAAERMLRIGRDADALAADLRSAGFAGVSLHEVPVTFVSPDLPGFLAVVRGNPGMRMPLAAAPADTDWEGRWAAFLAPGGPGAAKWMAASADGSPALTVEFLANVAVATA